MAIRIGESMIGEFGLGGGRRLLAIRRFSYNPRGPVGKSQTVEIVFRGGVHQESVPAGASNGLVKALWKDYIDRNS